MKNIIVFYGKKGSGKDACYEVMKNNYPTTEKLSFAGSLREVVWDLFEGQIIDKERVFGEIDKKEEPIETWPISSGIKELYGFKEEHWTGRRLLQWFGTEVCRELYSDIWIEKFKKKLDVLSDGSEICVTDCRFSNEYDSLKSLPPSLFSVKFVQVIRDVDDNGFSTHPSEMDMNLFKADSVIRNDGSLSDLQGKVLDVLES